MSTKPSKRINKEQLLRTLNKFKISVLSLVAALVIVGIVIWISGYSPFDIYARIFKGAFGSKMSVALIFSEATPLMFSGLAFAIAFKARIINVGVESQMIMGSLVGAIAGAYLHGLPHLVHAPLTLLIAGMAGMLLGYFICFLKVRFHAQEVVICIMMNSILLYVGSYLANGPLKAEGAGVAQTEAILDTAKLTKLIPKSQLTTGFLVGVAIAIVLAFILERTVLGYKIRVAGNNRTAGETYGIQATKLYYITFMLSGFIAAVGGSVLTQGVIMRFSDGAVSGYGFRGISVAALAMYNPLGVIFSSTLFGILNAGSQAVNRTTSIPYEFVDVIQVMVVVFISAPQIIQAVEKFFVNRVKKTFHKSVSGAKPDQGLPQA